MTFTTVQGKSNGMVFPKKELTYEQYQEKPSFVEVALYSALNNLQYMDRDWATRQFIFYWG